MKGMAAEGSNMGARSITDLDARVTSVTNKVNQIEDLFDAKLQAVSIFHYKYVCTADKLS